MIPRAGGGDACQPCPAEMLQAQESASQLQGPAKVGVKMEP